MAVVYGKPVDNRIPFFDEYLPTELDDVDAVVHDFKYGTVITERTIYSHVVLFFGASPPATS